MAGYSLLGNISTIQVTSPTTTKDVVVATIETDPSDVIVSVAVSRDSFDKNLAAETLTALANNIETIIGQGKAIGGTGTSSLDNNGLLAYFVTFTVGYDPPGVPPGQVTVDVDVPINLLTIDDPAINEVLLGEAEALVNAAYASLVALSKG